MMASPTDTVRPSQSVRVRPPPVIPALPVRSTATGQKRKSQSKLEDTNGSSTVGVAHPSPTVNGLAHNGPSSVSHTTNGEFPKGIDSVNTFEATETTPDLKLLAKKDELAKTDDKPQSPLYQTGSEGEKRGRASARSNGYRLPPPFYPASHPSSTSSPTSARSQQRSEYPAPHHSNPGASGIVFGGYPESSNPSPAPSASTESMAYSQPTPHFTPNAYAPPHLAPSSHAHHASEPVVPFLYPHQYYPPQYPPNVRPDLYYQQRFGWPTIPPPYYDRVPTFLPPDTHSSFPVTGGPVRADSNTQNRGFSNPSASSRASSHQSEYQDRTEVAQMNGYNGTSTGNGNAHMNGSTWVSETHQSQTRDGEQDNDLVQYIQSQYGEASYADLRLELSHSTESFEPISLPLHRLLVTRSPFIKRHAQQLVRGGDVDGAIIRIGTADGFLRPDAFELALKHLYGFPLLDLKMIQDECRNITTRGSNNDSLHGNTESQDTQDQMDLTLAYLAAGHLLEIQGVANRGSALISQLLTWNTIERAFSFALSGGLDNQWLSSDDEFTADEPSHAISNGSPPKSHSPPVGPTYGEYGSHVLDAVLRFLTSNFPANFRLDNSVQQSEQFPLLPSTHTKASLTDPRLRSIRFGDYSPDESTVINPNAALLSKLLISLPFPIIKFILEHPHLGNPQTGPLDSSEKLAIARAVVQERERRRQGLSRKSAAMDGDQEDDTLWDAIAWEEKVISRTADGGFEVTRSKVADDSINP